MKIKLTKKKLIDILNKEPLAAGGFILIKDKETGTICTFDEIIDEGQPCIGCAVGQTFRNLLSEDVNLRSLDAWCYDQTVTSACDASDGGDLDYALEAKLWLSALSIKFESLCSGLNARGKVIRSPNHPVKKQLITFIKENFPTKIEIDIDGFKLKKVNK